MPVRGMSGWGKCLFGGNIRPVGEMSVRIMHSTCKYLKSVKQNVRCVCVCMCLVVPDKVQCAIVTSIIAIHS